MQITSDLVKELREKTNAGVMDCKKALAQSKGDLSGAIEILKSQGAAIAQKKAQRATTEGVIFSYIHMGGKIGVLLELNCETDFVARNKGFQELAKDVALQIAGAHPAPLYVSRDEIPLEKVEGWKKEARAEFSGKSPEALEKILEGKLGKHYQEVCLLDQPFIKDPSICIKQLIQSKIAEVGENMVLRRFIRYQLGESL
ncbi:MAG: translation elongation factor Ts [Chlamydiae bacterium]|nr:translation elongation factor Ts [Chlamydiota bacterium]MBI3266169.1 translation elongation factor Ts [Chlamydiota bacterium]